MIMVMNIPHHRRRWTGKESAISFLLCLTLWKKTPSPQEQQQCPSMNNKASAYSLIALLLILQAPPRSRHRLAPTIIIIQGQGSNDTAQPICIILVLVDLLYIIIVVAGSKYMMPHSL
mmetsp:Transcript_39182/g.94746  ORF Transcript_39182/g.94746 Transcript_39182/m.94746 type:complete len:118 (-) Transcript_39182:1183-1536(-)